MNTALLGSKAIGVAALDCLSRHSNLRAAYTIDDRGDSRSAYADLTLRGAVVRPATDLPDVDLVVVAGWYEFIPPTLLARMPFVGIHHSLLPRHRGSAPLVWALMAGEETVGTSLFALTDRMDAGPLWGQAEVPVQGRYIDEVAADCDRAAMALLRDVLKGRYEVCQQDEGLATYGAPRNPADGLIDPTRPAAELERFVRAQSRPYPGAFLNEDAGRTIIWRATAVDDRLVIDESERAVA